MTITVKTVWIIAIIVVFISMIWFLFGTTAFFNRGIDLVMTAYYVFIWTPALLLIILSTILLKKGWIPKTVYAQVGFVIVIVFISIFFYLNLFRVVYTKEYTRGWLTETVRSDWTQTTSDGFYEYKLEVINVFQRNSYARLYVKDISTDFEMTIAIDISTKNIVTIGGVGSVYPEPSAQPVWSTLTPSNAETIYILTTTETFERWKKDNNNSIEKFEIDIAERTARKIE